MKKYLIIGVLIILSTTGFAQIRKGQYLVGGNAGFSSTSSGGVTQTTVSFNPNYGRFLVDKFALGLETSLSSTSETGSDAFTSYIVAPFLRYYFLPTDKKVNVFAQTSFGFGSASSGGQTSSANAFGASAGPAIFLSPNTALEITLNYVSSGGDGYVSRVGTFGMNVGFQIHLGDAIK